MFVLVEGGDFGTLQPTGAIALPGKIGSRRVIDVDVQKINHIFIVIQTHVKNAKKVRKSERFLVGDILAIICGIGKI